jgi:biotin transport system substrate-specific component
MSTIVISRPISARLTAVGAILFFATLTALTARITIMLPFTPVPVTLQVMTVLLAGLVLGPRAGAASQLAYLAAIAAGLPLDARGLGPAALFGPTAGYLVGFVLAAFVVGWLARRLASSRGGRFLAGLAGVAVIHACGAGWLAVAMGSLSAALAGGVAPFILIDLGKAFAAAAITETVFGAPRRRW